MIYMGKRLSEDPSLLLWVRICSLFNCNIDGDLLSLVFILIVASS